MEFEDTDTVPEPPKPPTTLEGLRAAFPFPSIREAQETALKLQADAYDTGKKYTILEVATGGGKSGIGMAPAIWSASSKREDGGANYLTSQNTLSNQLAQDFASTGLVQLRGKANYRCTNHMPLDCKMGSAMNAGGAACNNCPYRAAKNRYINGRLGVTNYAYFLTETMYSKELKRREKLICDEAHNIEKEILSIVDIKITQNRALEVDCGRIPIFHAAEDGRVRSWLGKVFIPKAAKHLSFLNSEIAEMEEMGSKVPADLQKRVEGLDQLMRNLGYYMDTDEPGDWLSWTDDREQSLVIKPLSAASFAQAYLFDQADRILLMSATILDAPTFRRSLGIPRSESVSLAIPTDFPQENRKIIFWPCGSMGAKSIQETMPLMAQRVEAILRAPRYAASKGIIHTHSYKINQFLHHALGQTEQGNRITTHSNGPGSREDAIAQHYKANYPSVLMSPSMSEGLDLKDDLSRIQLITKIPYPVLDPYNRARMDRDPKWYQLQTAIALMQMCGRSVRSSTDYATTVILDADFTRFLSANQDILPKWWTDSIEFR